MIYGVSYTALIFFLLFVGIVLGLSFYFGRKTRSSSSYYAAGGRIHWGVNGIAFAGDYLSAASFLGICGMIAVSGLDRKSTRLNSSHVSISYAVFCLQKQIKVD